MAALTGKERAALRAVIEAAFLSYDELDMFLDEFDHQLALITAPDGMDVVAFKVVKKAEEKGWLADLVENLLAERNDDPRLSAVAARLGVATNPAGPAAYKLGDLAAYDLHDIEAHFRDARIEREQSRVVIVAVDCQEAMFLDCVQGRIERIVGVPPRHRIQVDGTNWTVERVLKELATYADLLKQLAVFCPITVSSVAADLDRLAQGITKAFRAPDNELVVALFTPPGWPAPPTVARLPTPVPRPADVDQWVEALGTELGWDKPTRDDRRNRIVAAVKASDVPMYEIYKQLQDEIERLKQLRLIAA